MPAQDRQRLGGQTSKTLASAHWGPRRRPNRCGPTLENVRGEDAHYWRYVVAEQVESVPTQWADCHRQLIAGDRWIIDGMKLGVLGERLASADTVIYLDVSTLACLSGVLRRRIRFRGRLRPELGMYDRRPAPRTVTGRETVRPGP